MDSTTRDRILNSALILFAQKGLNGTTTREIALHSGSNVSMISYYFSGKEGLYKTVLNNFAEQVKSKLELLSKNFSPQVINKENLRSLLDEFLNYTIELHVKNPQIIAILHREIIEGLPNSRDLYEGLFHQVGEQMVQFLEVAKSKRIIRSDLNSHLFFMMLVEGIHGYCIAYSCKTPFIGNCYEIPRQLDDFKIQILDLFLKGIVE